MRTKIILFLGLMLSSAGQLMAHALWIEANASGKAGQAQAVKVFYGEYAANERDEISKWYSDVKDLSLWLVGPDGQKTQLKTVAGANFLSAEFVPQKDGAYTLVVSHEAKELGGTTKYCFLASSVVKIGNAVSIDPASNTNDLKVYPELKTSYKVNSTIKLNAVLKGAGKSEKAISVFSPSGWSKELTTGAGGSIEFVPLWPGKYVIEVQDFEKVPGQHNGANYEAVWKGATYSFDVVK